MIAVLAGQMVSRTIESPLSIQLIPLTRLTSAPVLVLRALPSSGQSPILSPGRLAHASVCGAQQGCCASQCDQGRLVALQWELCPEGAWCATWRLLRAPG